MIEESLAAGAVGLLGVVVGWKLNERSSAKARAEERAHQDRVRIREREAEAAAEMDRALLELRLPGPFAPEDDLPALAEAWGRAELDWRRGWTRSTIIGDSDLLDRYSAVGTTLFLASSDAREKRQPDGFLVDRAMDNARRALAAYRREEPLPPRTFPPTELLNKLVKRSREGRDYSELYKWLEANFAAGTAH